MISRKRSASVMSRLVTMTMSDTRTIAWLMFNAPYRDGRIVINRRVKSVISRETNIPLATLNCVVPRLIKKGLLSRVDLNKKRSTLYRLNMDLPFIKLLAKVPALPLFSEE